MRENARTLPPLRNMLLAVPAILCFAEALRLPWAAWGSQPGGILTAVLGLYLATRAIAAAPLPIPVIISGYGLAALVLGADLGWVRDDLLSALLVLLGFACFGWWTRIQRLWKR